MTNQPPESRSPSLEDFAPRAEAWGAWLHRIGLEGVVGALLEALDPLAPLGAQMLYLAQPTLALFGSQQAVGDLAEILEHPGGLAWLRQTMRLDE